MAKVFSKPANKWWPAGATHWLVISGTECRSYTLSAKGRKLKALGTYEDRWTEKPEAIEERIKAVLELDYKQVGA